jgi:hypothetical protein
MRIRSVTAHAFGPLGGQTLPLADGMTVVVGDNESAKSSWHAAIYAAVCGRRRGKGQPRKDEQRFIELHRPWDRDDWLVTAEVLLDDGRRIELRHDLAGKVDCHAKDLTLGDDISAEVMNEGAPDGARWLGLDRTSFASTACVEQADVLKVMNDADGLQETLQRAAATAGTDATAAAALECLDAFKREHVGRDQVNSTKPLRRATNRVQAAETAVQTATELHAQYLARVEQAEALHRRADELQRTVTAYEAAAAAYVAQQLSGQLNEAEQLDARFGGVAPAGAADDDELANAVASALASWRSAPIPADLGPRSSADIDAEIAALPTPPEGDTVVHDSVRLAEEQLARAEAQLQQHDRTRPAAAATSAPQVAAGDDELLELAHVLEAPLPTIPPELVQQERAAQLAASTPVGGKPPQAVVISAVVAVVLGLGGLVLGQAVIGGVLLIAAIGLGVFAFAGRRPAAAGDGAISAAATARAALLTAQEQAATAEQRRVRAIQRCGELGVAADPAALRAIPAARAAGLSAADAQHRWSAERAALADEFSKAAGALAGALTARGHQTPVPDVAALHAAAEEYRAGCATRADQAAAAARRTDLIGQRDAALVAEQRRAADWQTRDAAASHLMQIAVQCGISTDTAEQAEAELVEWQAQRSARVGRLDADANAWAQLQALLRGGTLEDLRSNAASAAATAHRLAAGAAPDVVAAIDGASASERLPELRKEAANAGNLASAADGELRQFAASVTSVPEAEEALEEARAELARVRELQETLDLTVSFLEAAQDRVHRDIAPLLADSVKAWLPKVTGGRYVDVIVTPTTLEVQVKSAGGNWRRADLLSYGTAEQIYLLLRIALADHLTRGHDTCPLLLDDVTVHADSARTVDILSLLHEVSKERQIVLFTQETDVAQWAQQQLSEPRDSVVHLTPVPAA